jgi:hypothetical protein
VVSLTDPYGSILGFLDRILDLAIIIIPGERFELCLGVHEQARLIKTKADGARSEAGRRGEAQIDCYGRGASPLKNIMSDLGNCGVDGGERRRALCG